MMCEELTERAAKCFICDEQQSSVKCEWIPVLEMVVNFSEDQQKELVEMCPFLDNICDKQSSRVVNVCSWETMSKKIQSASNKTFEFPYEKSKVEKLPVQEKEFEETVNEVKIKLPQNSNELMDYTLQRIQEHQIISRPAVPRNFCVFCTNKHVMTCKDLQEKNEKGKTIHFDIVIYVVRNMILRTVN